MAQDLTTGTERLLTRLRMWGVVQGFAALAVTVVASIGLMESLASPVARLLPRVPVNLVHVFAVGIGVFLGLIGFFAGDFWDRVFFEAFYGPQGKWLDTVESPLLLFPAGSALKRHRGQAAQALPRKAETGREIHREAAKLAKRQAERWERIEHPLILSRLVRGLLWPCLTVALLAFGAAVLCAVVGATTEVSRLLATGAVSLVLAVLFLVPYSHLRMEYMLRLYQDVAAHAGRRKPERR